MKKSVSILIGGDFAPINQAENIAIGSPENIWGNTLQLFQQASLSIINLETPLTDSFETINKTGPALKADKRIVNTLKAAKIDLVTLANNHILDFGEQGLTDTINVCENNEIDTVGAGVNLKESQKVYYKKVQETTIAVVNFAENEFNSATDNSAGSNPMDLIDNIKQIRTAKNNADFVIVIVHGGHEYHKYPSPRMQKQYRFYAEEGANVVIGHHTHCVSGYEIHNDVPIFYSLGNLFFPWDNKPNFWYEGYFLSLVLEEKNKIKFDLHFYDQCKGECSIQLVDDNHYDFRKKNINEINEVIANSKRLLIKWDEFVSRKQKEYFQYLLIPFNFVRRVVNKLDLIQFFITKYQKKLLLNLIRCESHQEVLVDVLKKSKKEKRSQS